MTLRECIENEFVLVKKGYKEDVISWLEEAMGIDAGDEITSSEIESICDRHYESSEEDMFDWIHDSGDESPTDIHNASWVDELDNVLILNDGSCFFWYEINN